MKYKVSVHKIYACKLIDFEPLVFLESIHMQDLKYPGLAL